MDLSAVEISELQTRQEVLFSSGGTVSDEDFEAFSLEQWCTPKILLGEGSKPTIAEVQAERARRGWARSGTFEKGLQMFGRIPKDKGYAVRLVDLKPDTGQTVQDPEAMIGVWNEGNGKLEGGTDVTTKMVDYFLDEKIKFLLRGKKNLPEHETGNNPEGGY